MIEPVIPNSSQLRTELARRKTELSATAQFLIFEPGLYAVEVHAAQSGSTDVGLRLPCIRIEAVPPSGNGGRATVSISAEGGWLSANTDTAFVLVTGGRAGGILTVYRASDGMPAPEIRIRSVMRDADLHAKTQAGPASMQPAPAPGPALEQTQDALPVHLLVHVTGKGDVPGSVGAWAGNPSGNAPIEGFAITSVTGLDIKDIECQGILGRDWTTPWHPGGEFCGSRGLALSLLGFRLRLTGDAASAYDCQYWGSFGGRGVIGPIAAGDACESNGAPLTGLRVEITPRRAVPADETPPAAVKPDAAPAPAKKLVPAAPKRGKAVASTSKPAHAKLERVKPARAKLARGKPVQAKSAHTLSAHAKLAAAPKRKGR